MPMVWDTPLSVTLIGDGFEVAEVGRIVGVGDAEELGHAVREESVRGIPRRERLVVRSADDVHRVLHISEVQINVEGVPFDVAARRVYSDRCNAAFADAVVHITQKEMNVFVRVNVPVPSDEVRKGLQGFRRLLVIELDGRHKEVSDLDVVRRESLPYREVCHDVEHDVVRVHIGVIFLDEYPVEKISPIRAGDLPREHEA